MDKSVSCVMKKPSRAACCVSCTVVPILDPRDVADEALLVQSFPPCRNVVCLTGVRLTHGARVALQMSAGEPIEVA